MQEFFCKILSGSAVQRSWHLKLPARRRRSLARAQGRGGTQGESFILAFPRVFLCGPCGEGVVFFLQTRSPRGPPTDRSPVAGKACKECKWEAPRPSNAPDPSSLGHRSPCRDESSF